LRPGNDEYPEPAVWCADAGSGKAVPRRVIPDVGQVSENTSKCSHSRFGVGISQTPRAGFHVGVAIGAQQSSHILGDHQRRSERINGVAHSGPQPGSRPRTHAFASAGRRNVLAWKASGEDVHGFYLRPVNGGDVAQVWYVRVVVGEDFART
jgi:hypothetical protein